MPIAAEYLSHTLTALTVCLSFTYLFGPLLVDSLNAPLSCGHLTVYTSTRDRCLRIPPFPTRDVPRPANTLSATSTQGDVP